MKVPEGLSFEDMGIIIKSEDCLILGDFHLGQEEALSRQGVLVPRFSFQDITTRLKPLLKKRKLIVINGDLKHEFGSISAQEWREVSDILGILKSKCNRLVLVKGNHDTILGLIAKIKDVEVVESIMVGGFLVTHGHKLPAKEEFRAGKGIIIGHEHPAITLRDGGRSETYKAFLVGKYNGKTLIVMPSFNLLTPGTDVLKEKMLSPFLQQSLSDFEVYIVEDTVYYFGKIKNLLRK